MLYYFQNYVPHQQISGSSVGQIQRLLMRDSQFSWGWKASRLSLERSPSSHSPLASLGCKENMGKRNCDGSDHSGVNKAPW